MCWLQALDAELIIDTPGVEDLSERRAAFTFDVLSQRDAVVLLTNATIPFSRTEGVNVCLFNHLIKK